MKHAPVAKLRETNVIILAPKHFMSYAPISVVRKKTASAPVSYIETSYDFLSRISEKKGITNVINRKPTSSAKKASKVLRLMNAVRGT